MEFGMGYLRRIAAAVLAVTLLGSGCERGEEDHDEGRKSESHEAKEGEKELTPFQLENGIGPVKAPITLGAIDRAMADSGKKVFTVKCSGCHKMDTLYVGPALGEVTTRRTGAFIMNMILNPQEMVEHHPVAKQMLAERMSFMADQHLTLEEARAVLEYLRTQSKPRPTP